MKCFSRCQGARPSRNSATRPATVRGGLPGEVVVTGQAVRGPCVLIVPIRIRDRVEGLIEVADRAVRPFGEREEALLRRLAEHAAVAIRNSQAFAEQEIELAK